MDKKLNLKTVRTLTVPLSVQETLTELYNLAESEWDPDNSWDNFMEMAQTIIRQESFNSYLEMNVHYVEDEDAGE